MPDWVDDAQPRVDIIAGGGVLRPTTGVEVTPSTVPPWVAAARPVALPLPAGTTTAVYAVVSAQQAPAPAGPDRDHASNRQHRSCAGMHVPLAESMLLRRADAVEVVGAALTEAAAGAGHRRGAAPAGLWRRTPAVGRAAMWVRPP